MHAQPSTSPEKAAFTLTELLVVVAVLFVLATLALSTPVLTEEKAHRLACLNNLRQLGLGSMMYAHDYNGHFSSYTWFEGGFVPTIFSDRSGSDDDVTWLHPHYVKSLSSFVCPATQNYVRTNSFITKPNGGTVLRDLCNNAVSPTAAGTSYEVNGTFTSRATGTAVSTKKTVASVAAFTIFVYTPAIGMKPGPSRVFLLRDADDTNAIDRNDNNDWPDFPTDNHGAEGMNFSFCDGHAEWVSQSRFMQVWNMGQDSNRVAP